MAIRIKSGRIHSLAKELAAMTGETQVAAICRALERRLAEPRLARGERNVLSGLPATPAVDEKPSHE